MPKTKARPWEVWHDKATAQRVDDYWRSSPDEATHRRGLARFVLESMPSPTANILEVGCGTGLVYEALQEVIGPDLAYKGIDNSRAMLARALNRFPLVAFEYGDAFKLKYEPGAFDMVLAFELFGHMPDFTKPLLESIRVAGHTAIFTLWVGGKDLTLGPDHYEYPERMVASLLDTIACPSEFEWFSRDYGPIRAYAVIEQ